MNKSIITNLFTSLVTAIFTWIGLHAFILSESTLWWWIELIFDGFLIATIPATVIVVIYNRNSRNRETQITPYLKYQVLLLVIYIAFFQFITIQFHSFKFLMVYPFSIVGLLGSNLYLARKGYHSVINISKKSN